MTEERKKFLLDEHVRLTAQFVAGNQGATVRLAEIEQELGMSAFDIMKKALSQYSKEY